jgi:hypothetical protein
MSLYEDEDLAVAPEATTAAGWSKGLNMAQSANGGRGRGTPFVARKIVSKPTPSSQAAPVSLPPVVNLGGGGGAKMSKMDTAPRIFSFGADKVSVL